jgi:hypothetical protein
VRCARTLWAGVLKGNERMLCKMRVGTRLLRSKGGDVACMAFWPPWIIISEKVEGIERSQSLRGHATSSPACGCMVIVQSLRILEAQEARAGTNR